MKPIKFRAWSEKIGAFIYWQSDQKAALGMFWELCRDEKLEPERWNGVAYIKD
jgi:hypothetical protein